MDETTSQNLRLALPKGRMYDGVARLLSEAGVDVKLDSRGYRPVVSLPDVETKLLKPQSIVGMLLSGSRDLGFTGRDWVAELDGEELVEMLDTGLDRVRLIAAMPERLAPDGQLPRGRALTVASEYRRLTLDWIEARELDAKFVQSWGATEVYPPEDADCIVDNTATGATLRANGLTIVDTLLESSTCLWANRRTLDDPVRRDRIESICLILRSVLDARERVMLEVNVDASLLAAIVDLVPCMREPTVSPLHGSGGFAVKAAVPRRDLPTLIPRIRNAGGTDLVVSRLDQIIP